MSQSYLDSFGVSKSSTKNAREIVVDRLQPIPDGMWNLRVVSASLYLNDKNTGEALDYPVLGLIVSPTELHDSRTAIIRMKGHQNTDMEKFGVKMDFLFAALDADPTKILRVNAREEEQGFKRILDLKGRCFVARISGILDQEGVRVGNLYNLDFVEGGK